MKFGLNTNEVSSAAVLCLFYSAYKNISLRAETTHVSNSGFKNIIKMSLLSPICSSARFFCTLHV